MLGEELLQGGAERGRVDDLALAGDSRLERGDRAALQAGAPVGDHLSGSDASGLDIESDHGSGVS